MKRLFAMTLTVLSIAAACGGIDEPMPSDDNVPVRGVELSAAAGQVSSSTYVVSFQLGRGQQATSAAGSTVSLDSATPIRDR